MGSQLIEYEEEKEKEEISTQIQVQQIVEQRFKLLNELYGIDEQSSESINEPVAILHHDTVRSSGGQKCKEKCKMYVPICMDEFL